MPGTSTPPKEDMEFSKKTSFKLPDSVTSIWITDNNHGDSTELIIGSGEQTLARWANGAQTRLSPAMINDERAQYGPVLELELLNLAVADPQSPFATYGQQQDLALTWASIYALWLHPGHRDDDLIAISVEEKRVGEYIQNTGLGVISPFSTGTSTRDTVFWLGREAFWQGAGAPDSQHWLQSRPEVTSFPGFNGTMGVFPSQLGFTRKGNVCTVHP
ncbi:hypothetical protein F66182_11051, partial [Fusarium sp. NRRL 66182]